MTSEITLMLLMVALISLLAGAVWQLTTPVCPPPNVLVTVKGHGQVCVVPR